MLRQIVISPIRDTFQFLPSKREIVFDVVSSLGIERTFFVGNSEHVEFATRDSDVLVKLEPLFFPIFEQLHPLLYSTKIFQLHLLKLARAKSEIARIDFVAKRFSNLRDPERQFLARDFQDIFELNENRLRGFGAKISQ